MAHDSTASVATKSIDVGSMFLMDLSVNESDLPNSLGDLDKIQLSTDNEMVFPMSMRNLSNNSKYQQAGSYENSINAKLLTNNTQSIDSYNKYQTHQKVHYHYNNQHRHNNNNNRNHRQEQIELLSNNSLDRLATVINGGKQSPTNKLTITDSQPHQVIIATSDEHQSATSSLSDKHYVASSSGTSSTSSGGYYDNNKSDSLSSDISYAGASCSEVDNNSDHERASTTREDSGVLDMKDLVGSQKLSNSFEDNQINFNSNQVNKQISNVITATNLISKQSAYNNLDNSYVAATTTTKKQTIDRSTDNPTNNKNNHNNNNNHNHSQGSKRSVSASLPIQVPTRQMKKDLHKLKLSLINKNIATPVAGNNNDNITATSSTTTEANINQSTTDDFDEFLEQEYNDNHHNHYERTINEYDIEHLHENPMKLFESIQALARSLHEDAELFGSLPPKRMLESPIRSLAFT